MKKIPNHFWLGYCGCRWLAVGAAVRREVRYRGRIEPVSDHVREAERDELAQHFLAVAGEMERAEQFILARHNISDFERAEDSSERFRTHVSDVICF